MKKLIFILIACCLGCENQQVDIATKIEGKLNEAITKFEPTISQFLFTIIHNDTAIIQIVNSNEIEALQSQNGKFGMALHLAFDPTFESEIHDHERFKRMKLSEQFTYYDWQGIPCYALELGVENKKNAKLITEILTDLYGYDLKDKFEIELLDQSQN
jgi:hypothetical protein